MGFMELILGHSNRLDRKAFADLERLKGKIEDNVRQKMCVCYPLWAHWQ
jgi:hypothetical protein